MFEKYLANDRVEIDRIPLKEILDSGERLFIFTKGNITEVDDLFKHLTGKSIKEASDFYSARILEIFDTLPAVTSYEIQKSEVVITNIGQVLATRRNLAEHVIVFDSETLTVTYLIPPQ